ncbi:MAG: Sb-PDE family phosphodiesterase [Rhodothermales bacterium]
MKSLLALVVILLSATSFAHAQHHHTHALDRVIKFPDVPGYLTLTADLHMHTVFSDGSVWPNIRVQEALRDGLDVIAITEHLEYQPHQDDIPHPDRNRAYNVALNAARNSNLLIIPGSEITRDMPPGHSNAIFIDDANKLLVDDAVEAFQETRNQGGFTFWNHPNWTAQRKDGIARLDDMHRQLIDDGLLHGIEVVNEHTYSDEALQIALDHNLTIIGTSDIHGLIDWDYEPHAGGHRPVTLVFAEERTLAGVQEALEARRTVAYFNELLIGREAHVLPLVTSAIQVTEAVYGGDTQVLRVTLENTSDAPFTLMNRSLYTFHANADVVHLHPHDTYTLEVKTRERLDAITLPFEVLNAVTAPNTHPTLSLTITPSN